MKVNRNELAALLGVSLPTINAKIKKGMPYVTRGARGKEWTFETADVLAWEKDQAIANTIGDTQTVDRDELLKRKLAAETALAEIEAAKKKGEVADLSEIELAWENTLVELRSRFRQIPQRVALQLLGAKNETDIKEILADEIDQCLTTLAYEFDDDIDGE